MTAVHIAIGSLAIAFNAAAALWGSWFWYARRPSRVFWYLLRSGQAFVVIEAILGGIWIATGTKVSGLHIIYGLVPIFLGFMAEQLRVSAAQMILDKRGFLTPKDVGEMDAAGQHAIVVAVVRREIGVMTLASWVTLVLIIRAAMVHGH